MHFIVLVTSCEYPGRMGDVIKRSFNKVAICVKNGAINPSSLLETEMNIAIGNVWDAK